MDFTSRLFLETKQFHKLVDDHSFTNNIKNSKNIGDIYINFNKMCIESIQQIEVASDFTEIYKKLYRETFTFDDIYISNELNLLIERCKKYPLEHSYLFYLGLLSGGNILKKYISEKHHLFLTFENPNILRKEFKDYLNNKIKTKEQQENFIKIVSETYLLIKKCFDKFPY
jgi:hypothetical protein